MYAELQQLIENEDFPGIVKLTSNLDSSEFKNQPDVLRSRAVALIRLEKYEETLKFINQCNIGLELVFEEAYCCYRLNKLTDSLELLNDAIAKVKAANPKSSLLAQLAYLKAQVCYRLEEFDKSLDIYKKLPQDEDTSTNILAVEAVKQACTNSSTYDPTSTTEPSAYAALFNFALFQLSKNNDYKSALETLDQASASCLLQMSNEGYSQQDIEKELLVISAQKAYVYQMTTPNQSQKALEVYQRILDKAELLDPVIVAIAANNQLAAKSKCEKAEAAAMAVVEVSRALKLVQTPGILAKLNSAQMFIVEFNGLIYSLLVGKNTVAASKLEALYGKAGQDVKKRELLVSVEAAMLVKQHKNTLQDIEAFVEIHPDSMTAYLFLFDHLIKSSSFHAVENHAVKLLDLPDFQHYRAQILSILIWVLEKQDKVEIALEMLEKYGKSEGTKTSASNSFQDMKQRADFKIKSGRYEQAKLDLESILVKYPSLASIQEQAGLLLCLARLEPPSAKDKEKMKELMEKVQPFCSVPVIQDADAEKLRALPGKGAEKAAKEKQVKKKKRKSKPLPKNYDAGKAPDPERWIPKSMRKATKAKQQDKRGKGKMGQEEVTGFGFQGVALQGGGIGSTGSAKIAGFKVPVAPAPVTVEEEVKEEPVAAKNFPPKKSGKGGKKKR